MSIFEKHRFEIFNQTQHPYKHPISDFYFTHDALPGITNLESALDWILAVLYPNAQDSVADVASLPSVGNTINDYRIVLDDGDGKIASYRWEQREGDASAKWYKIYDIDWGVDSVLSQFYLKTQDIYASKIGYDDRDYLGTVITGDLAGQTIYGGRSANTNLTLKANAGDGVGANTGYVQVGDNFRPLTDNVYDLGSPTYRFANLYVSTTIASATSVTAGTLVLASGSITDTSGAISFANENLTTTGTLASGTHTIGTLVLAAGSITDTSGTISFANENLTTTGTLASGAHTIGTLVLASGSITSTSGSISFDNENLTTTGVISGANGIFTGYVEVGYTGTETSGIDVNGVTYACGFRVNEVGGTNPAQLMIHRHSATLPAALVGARANDDTTGHTAVTNSQLLFAMYGAGYTGTHYDLFGSLTIESDSSGTISGTSSPGRVSLYVTPDTSNTPELAFYVANNKKGFFISDMDVAGIFSVDRITHSGVGTVAFDVGIFPTTDSVLDIGKTGQVWNDLWIDGNITNGTNSISIATLLSFRNALSGASTGMSLFYDSGTGLWTASLPDTEIDHGAISGLLDDDHTQYALLAGRSTGQTLTGGTAAGEDLTLESTSHGTKGNIFVSSPLAPTTNAAYSGGWSGTDLGDSSHYFNDVYTKGEMIGLRLENYTSGTLPSPSAQNVGRLVYATDTNKIYVDTGSAFIVAGVGKYISDLSFNGSDTTKDVDVSATVTDARNCIIQLLDNSNDFERVFCVIKATSISNVRISTNPALPAGSYRLICLE